MSEYKKQWQDLNVELRELESRSGDLRAVFAALHDHQLETGFIQHDPEAISRFEFCHPELGSRCFRIQFNPERAERFNGAGVQSPPAGAESLHDGCFLCPSNIHWQQQERQFGYELEINQNAFIAWMNPFPLLPGHIVLASKDHRSQEWNLHPSGELDPGRIVADIVELVSRAPGYAGFYNGVDAGASIPGHLHYQVFRPLEHHRQYPLEIEAAAARKANPGEHGWRLGEYPMESMHWHGQAAEIVDQFSAWIEKWAAHQDNLPELAANILAISDEQEPVVSLFFVPRDRRKSRASGMAAKVGGLEVLGELVFSTPEEQQLLESGQLDFFNLERVLAGARTPLNMP